MTKYIFIIGMFISAMILIPDFAFADETLILLKIAQGQEYEKAGKFQEAIAEYEKAMNEDPNSKYPYMSLGQIYQYKFNNSKKAIEYYKRGLSFAPKDYDMNLSIMYAYFHNCDFENALDTYVILSKIDHKSFHSFTSDALDEILLNMNEEKKISFCKKYLSINPGDSILRKKLSELYLDGKDYNNARSEFEARLENISNVDNVGRIYFGIAVCDYYLGEYHSSLNYFSKAKELGEHVPDQYFKFVREKLKEGE
jgi:tetratricopeptide (TPR) repeat protein